MRKTRMNNLIHSLNTYCTTTDDNICLGAKDMAANEKKDKRRNIKKGD